MSGTVSVGQRPELRPDDHGLAFCGDESMIGQLIPQTETAPPRQWCRSQKGDDAASRYPTVYITFRLRGILLLRLQAADSVARFPIQDREAQRRQPMVDLLSLSQGRDEDRGRRRQDGMERRPVRQVPEEALTVVPLASHATSGPLQVRDVRRSSWVGRTRPRGEDDKGPKLPGSHSENPAPHHNPQSILPAPWGG